jgi:putative protein-disulfide isomerase
VLVQLAGELGLASAQFETELEHQGGAVLAEHLVASRRGLARLGGAGFPTLALQRDGQLQRLDIGAWLGRPEAWRDWLLGQAAAPAEASLASGCTLERPCEC